MFEPMDSTLFMETMFAVEPDLNLSLLVFLKTDSTLGSSLLEEAEPYSPHFSDSFVGKFSYSCMVSRSYADGVSYYFFRDFFIIIGPTEISKRSYFSTSRLHLS